MAKKWGTKVNYVTGVVGPVGSALPSYSGPPSSLFTKPSSSASLLSSPIAAASSLFTKPSSSVASGSGSGVSGTGTGGGGTGAAPGPGPVPVITYSASASASGTAGTPHASPRDKDRDPGAPPTDWLGVVTSKYSSDDIDYHQLILDAQKAGASDEDIITLNQLREDKRKRGAEQGKVYTDWSGDVAQGFDDSEVVAKAAAENKQLQLWNSSHMAQKEGSTQAGVTGMPVSDYIQKNYGGTADAIVKTTASGDTYNDRLLNRTADGAPTTRGARVAGALMGLEENAGVKIVPSVLDELAAIVTGVPSDYRGATVITDKFNPDNRTIKPPPRKKG